MHCSVAPAIYKNMLAGNPTAVSKYFGTAMYSVTNIIFITESLSTLDSTFTSAAKLLGPEFLGILEVGQPQPPQTATTRLATLSCRTHDVFGLVMRPSSPSLAVSIVQNIMHQTCSMHFTVAAVNCTTPHGAKGSCVTLHSLPHTFVQDVLDRHVSMLPVKLLQQLFCMPAPSVSSVSLRPMSWGPTRGPQTEFCSCKLS